MNEFLYAATCLCFDTFAVVTGAANQANWLSVVVVVGRGHTTTSGRARRSVRDMARPRVGVLSARVRAIPYSSMDTTTSRTTWSCWIVTERSLGNVSIEYDKDRKSVV